MENKNQQLTLLLDLMDAFEKLKYAQKTLQVVSPLRMQELGIILHEILIETSHKMTEAKMRFDCGKYYQEYA
jgi:hypothetical protein